MLTHFYHSVTRLRSLNLLVAASFAMLLGACSSTTSESRLVLNLPDWQKLHKETAAKQNKISSSAISDEAEIEFLSIKVSGSGLPQPLTELWKHKDGETPKMQASFVIPRGTSVLVQVLAVYGGNVSTEFYYGDNTVNADREIVGAEIKLQLANVTGTVEGNIVGRYMDSANHGPTGVFEYHFDPDSMPGGKPSMVVTTGEIFGGWLRAFHLNSRLLQYKWPNGHFVFDPSDDAQLFSAAQSMRSARIYVPHGFRVDGSDTEEQPQQTVTAGFFGPGASTERLCLQPAGANVDQLFESASALPAEKFKWTAHSTPAPGEEGKTIRVIDPDLLANDYDKGGDVSSTCAADSGGAEYSTYLKFNQDKIASGDEVLDFRGPFRKLASGKFLGRSHDNPGQRVILTWSFLPGADTDLDGVSVFWRRMPATGYNDHDIKGDDGYRCADFRNLAAFTPSFNEINLANNAFSAQIPGIATEAESQLIQAVVCPRLRDGTLSSSGISTDSGGGGGSAAATKVAALGIDSQPAATAATAKFIQSTVCSPIVLQAKNDSNQSSYVGYAGQLQITAGDSNDLLYFDSSCTSPAGATNNMNLSDFWDRRVVYLKTSRASGTGSVSVTATGGTTLSPTSFFFSVVPKTAATEVVTVVKDKLFAFECSDALLVGRDAQGAPAEVGVSYSLTLNSQTGMHFFGGANADCGGAPESSVSFGGLVTKERKFLYNGTGTSISIQPVASGTPIPVVPSSVDISQPGTATSVSFGLPNHMDTDSCYPVRVYARDANFHTTPNMTGSLITVDGTALNGTFFASNTCTSAAVANPYTFSIPAGSWQSTNTVFFRPSQTGAASLSLSNSTLAVAPAFNITVMAPQPKICTATTGGWDSTDSGVFIDNASGSVTSTTFYLTSNSPNSNTSHVITVNARACGPTGAIVGIANATSTLNYAVPAVTTFNFGAAIPRQNCLYGKNTLYFEITEASAKTITMWGANRSGAPCPLGISDVGSTPPTIKNGYWEAAGSYTAAP